MLIGLLGVTLAVTLLIATATALVFVRPIRRILQRIVGDDLSAAWVRYLVFATFVVGAGGGVNIRQMERYITPQGADPQVLALTRERWIIEVYSSALGALGAITWMLLVFFVFALVAYVMVRAFEMKRRDRVVERTEAGEPEGAGS